MRRSFSSNEVQVQKNIAAAYPCKTPMMAKKQFWHAEMMCESAGVDELREMATVKLSLSSSTGGTRRFVRASKH
ncbi:hypothetical protein M3J09_000613 [Ascochyta lentis]